MMKFTEGPWEVLYGGRPDDGYFVIGSHGAKRVLAENPAGAQWPEMSADAQLIAAAPDLLRLLNALFDAYPSGTSSDLVVEICDILERLDRDDSDRMSMPGHFRVVLMRNIREHRWAVVANPCWDVFTRAQNDILLNSYNEYAEYRNSGVITRMIRASDFARYMDGEIHPEWALDPSMGDSNE